MKNKEIIEKLIKKKISISSTESCTGGKFASEITSVPNSSKIFNFGLITYSNKSKENFLNVKKTSLKKHGAVSAQVCKEMVEGLFKISKSKICVSITGIAGPKGGNKLKPIGLVYIGFKYNKKTKIYEFNFNKKFKRQKIQTLSVNNMFKIISLSI
jgi:nicotinamide-nucleotide amidase